MPGLAGSARAGAATLPSGVLRRVLALALMAVILNGCTGRERVCASGQYPVKAVGNTTGRTCVPDGQQPPVGYVRYPEGKEPRYIDDEWDKYWRSVVVDSRGNIVSGG